MALGLLCCGVMSAGCSQSVELFADRARGDVPDAGELPGEEDVGADAREMPRPIGPTAPPLSVGERHACVVAEGAIRCWGANYSGQLGPGIPRGAVLEPTRIDEASDWVEIECGRGHSCGRKRDGRVWCWGENSDGQLGQGDKVERAGMVEVALPGVVIDLVSNFDHTFALLGDGRVYCWGSDSESQCGVGFGPDTRPSPVLIEVADDWVAMAAGDGHSCGIRRSGELWCWGRNTQGMSGHDPAVAGDQVVDPLRVGDQSGWLSVAATQSHSCALNQAGALFCFGDNFAGQLGVEGLEASFAMIDTGLRDVAEVSIGTFSSCARQGSGSVYCWGRNIEGQLGVGQADNRGLPGRQAVGGAWQHIEVGRFHACSVSPGGKACCTGENKDGRLGLGDTSRRSALTCPD